MTKSDAIAYFGSQKAIYLILGRSKSTVSNYPEKLPRGVQFELHVKTNGALKVDAEFMNEVADNH